MAGQAKAGEQTGDSGQAEHANNYPPEKRECGIGVGDSRSHFAQATYGLGAV